MPLLALVAFLAPGGEEMSLSDAPRRCGDRRRLDRRPDRRRPLSAQSAVPDARRFPRPRSHDGGRTAGRARLRARHAARRPVDGDGRIPRRRACCPNRPSAISSKPTSSRSAASCSACSSWRSACRSTCRSSPRTGRRVAIYVVAYMVMKAVGIYVVARITSSHRDALERAVVMAQGGEFAFVLYSAATAVGIIDGEANAILTAIIIVSMILTPLRHRRPARGDAEGRADARRRRHRRRAERQRAHHRLRPLRPDRQPALAASRRRRLDHRQRRRDDPGGRRFRLQGLLRRRHPPRHIARRRRRPGARRPDLRRQGGGRRPHRREHEGTNSRWCRCWRAPTTGAPRSG